MKDEAPTVVSELRSRSIGSKLLARFEPSSSKQRLIPVEGIRGFAALLVFFVHFNALFAVFADSMLQKRIFGVLASLGHAGVDIFFLLSGYLMCGIVMKSRFAFGDYLWRRVRRIYPTFLAVFAIYMVGAYLLPARSRIPDGEGAAVRYILANLLMLPGVFHITPIISVAWSLSYEWFFYLALPATIGLFHMRNWRWQWRLAYYLAMMPISIWVGGRYATLGSAYATFMAGNVLWELLHNTRLEERLPRYGEVVAAALFAVVLLLVGIFGPHSGIATLVLDRVPFFYAPALSLSGGLVILYSISYNGFLSRFYSWRPLRWVGNMSYSYYLIHGVTLIGASVVVAKVLGPHKVSGIGFLLLFGACVALTLGIAAILYLTVEWPFSLEQKPKSAAAPSRERGPVRSRLEPEFQPLSLIEDRVPASSAAAEIPSDS